MCLMPKCLFGQTSQSEGSQGSSSTSSNRQPKEPSTINLNGEYKQAFKSKSYQEFVTKVKRLTGNLDEGNGHSTRRSRLPSYRLLLDNHLEPDRETVKKMLQLTDRSHNHHVNLVSDYFVNSEEASKLCVLLLQNLDEARHSYRSIQKVLDKTPIVGEFTESQCNFIIREFQLFMQAETPFCPTTLQYYQAVHQHYDDLQKKLKNNRNLKLDAAIKGTYIPNKDLDTISCLVTRLKGEFENNRDIVRFCLDRKDDRHPVQEVVRQLRKNDNSLNEQLDDLEKHIYLCLININRTRRLVAQEIHPFVHNSPIHGHICVCDVLFEVVKMKYVDSCHFPHAS